MDGFDHLVTRASTQGPRAKKAQEEPAQPGTATFDYRCELPVGRQLSDQIREALLDRLDEKTDPAYLIGIRQDGGGLVFELVSSEPLAEGAWNKIGRVIDKVVSGVS